LGKNRASKEGVGTEDEKKKEPILPRCLQRLNAAPRGGGGLSKGRRNDRRKIRNWVTRGRGRSEGDPNSDSFGDVETKKSTLTELERGNRKRGGYSLAWEQCRQSARVFTANQAKKGEKDPRRTKGRVGGA